MTKEALTYYHRMRDQGFSVDASRNSILIMFTEPAEFERRMKRYPLSSVHGIDADNSAAKRDIEHRQYQIDESITRGTEAEMIRGLERRYNQLRKGGDMGYGYTENPKDM